MSNKIIPMLTSDQDGKSPLDEFLPESLFAPEVRGDRRNDDSNANVLPPNEVQLDPIEQLRLAVVTKPSTVQLWPMLAAGLVAVGVTMLALSIVSKYTALGF